MKCVYNIELSVDGEKADIDRLLKDIESFIFFKTKGQDAYDKKLSVNTFYLRKVKL
jgi:hypothetical protein